MLNDVGLPDFFQGFNVLFPLFHKPSFDACLEKQYSNDPPTDSGWYAAFNIVLAISCRLRISHTPAATGGPSPDIPVGSHIQDAWKYFQNSAVVLTELILRNTDLMSIQAILGMVCVDGPNPPLFFFLFSFFFFLSFFRSFLLSLFFSFSFSSF